MPKIAAATVAEHNEQRRAALLSAATTLLAEQGIDGVTLGAVGAAAGIARSTVYQYFDSAPALIAAVVEDVMPRAGAQLTAAMAEAESPIARLDAFMDSVLVTATDPVHRSMRALEDAHLPPECLARVAELHREQFRPLQAVIVELGAAEPELVMRFVLATVSAASAAILAGAPRDVVLAQALQFIHAGIPSPKM